MVTDKTILQYCKAKAWSAKMNGNDRYCENRTDESALTLTLDHDTVRACIRHLITSYEIGLFYDMFTSAQ